MEVVCQNWIWIGCGCYSDCNFSSRVILVTQNKSDGLERLTQNKSQTLYPISYSNGDPSRRPVVVNNNLVKNAFAGDKRSEKGNKKVFKYL